MSMPTIQVTDSKVKVLSLPIEILSTIFSILGSLDRLTCLRVCKRWNDAISRTVLYDQLKLEKPEKVTEALSLFNQNQHIARNVRHLSFLLYDFDIELLLSLPTLFLNITSLDWIERRNNINMTENLKGNFQQALKAWIKLERIVEDSPKNIHITTSLLGSYTCNNLQRLEIKFKDIVHLDNGDIINDRSILQDLVKNIHNAPLLRTLSLSDTGIKLADLEGLHAGLPNLQELKLDEVYLYHDEREAINVTTEANSLRSFSMEFSSTSNSDALQGNTEFEGTIARWLNYCGDKYKSVELFQMIFCYGYTPLHESTLLEAPLTYAISNMKNISSYDVGVYPLTAGMLSLMNQNKVRLNKLKIWIPDGATPEQQIQVLQNSNPVSTVEKLEINCYQVRDNGMMLLSGILYLCHNLPRLNHLVIVGSGVSLLVDVIQHLPMIETLGFHLIQLRRAHLVDVALNSNTIKPCNIKNLNIRVFYDEQYTLDQVNRTFDFVLRSCPLLETFKLSGSVRIRESGAFNLDFEDNTQLKSISIDSIYGCSYYTFNELPGEVVTKWRSYNDDKKIEMDSDTQQRQHQSYHINLDYDEEEKIKINLDACRRI